MISGSLKATTPILAILSACLVPKLYKPDTEAKSLHTSMSLQGILRYRIYRYNEKETEVKGSALRILLE